MESSAGRTASCSQCAQPPCIELRYAGTRLCATHFLESFARRAKAEVARCGGLPEGTVAVALSGGKDSVSLLHFLHGLAKDRPGVRLAAVTVDEGIAGYRDSALAICEQVTQRLGVPWRVVRTKDLAGYAIDDYAAGVAGPAAEGHLRPVPARPACGPCGVFRRTGMNRLARDLGAAAIATGHNLDDAAQTILMNHLKGDLDRAARLAPHAPDEAKEDLVRRIQPFRGIPEKEVLLYAVLNGLPLHDEAECPYAARSQRFALREVLVRLEDATPGTRHALLAGQDRLQPILRAALPTAALGCCASCGEPTSAQTCMACRLKA